MASYTSHLISSEIKPGGPYYTWIVSKTLRPKWNDVDIVVNFNIGFFLRLQEISLPPLNKLAEGFIKKPFIKSKYYLSPIITFYFLSKFYDGNCELEACQEILKHQNPNGLWSNDLETALALSTLIRFGAKKEGLQKAISHLLKISEQKNWRVYPLYVEEYIRGKPVVAGSSYLTASFILEALTLFFKKEENQKKVPDDALLLLQKEIKMWVRQSLRQFPHQLFLQAEKILDPLLQTDHLNSITLIPYYVIRSLGQSIPEKFHILLGQASLYGTLSYTIYDNLLDHELPIESLLIANHSNREMLKIYENLSSSKSLEFIHQILLEMELANAWEIQNTRLIKSAKKWSVLSLPNYGDFSILAEKSIGIAIAAIYFIGPKIKKYYHHYLIARQLNDDAHDWWSDLEAGRLNSVSTEIIKSYTCSSIQKLNLKNKEKTFQKIFAEKTIISVSEKILYHLDKARDVLGKIENLRDRSYFEKLLQPLYMAARRALAEQKQVKQFLQELKL